MKKEKELPELPPKEAEIKLVLVEDNFPIEGYLDWEGNPVKCVKRSEAEAQALANTYKLIEEIEEIKRILN